MPRYSYHCENCEETFEQSHSMTIVLDDCHLCGSQKTLNKLVSNVRVVGQNKEKEARKPGDVVKQHIEETRQDIRREKEIITQEYD